MAGRPHGHLHTTITVGQSLRRQDEEQVCVKRGVGGNGRHGSRMEKEREGMNLAAFSVQTFALFVHKSTLLRTQPPQFLWAAGCARPSVRWRAFHGIRFEP